MKVSQSASPIPPFAPVTTTNFDWCSWLLIWLTPHRRIALSLKVLYDLLESHLLWYSSYCANQKYTGAYFGVASPLVAALLQKHRARPQQCVHSPVHQLAPSHQLMGL